MSERVSGVEMQAAAAAAAAPAALRLARPARFTVQREEPRRIQGQLHHLIERAHGKPIDPSRLYWSYAQNPEGPAVIWTVRDSQSGGLAGFTAALPRRMRVDGRERRAWIGADFSILKEYRTLGIALRLRREARNEINAGNADFLYSLPNERMRLIHQKVGHARLGRLVRLARPVRTRRYFERRLRPRVLARVLAPWADLALASRGRPFRRGRSSVQVVDSPVFDERFDRLFERAAPQHRILGVRDASYLTWRWTMRPGERTRAVLAECAGDLAGYLLFQVQGRVAVVVDMLGHPFPEIHEDLIEGLVAEARDRRLDAVSFTTLEGSPLIALFGRHGFLERPEDQEVFTYVGPDPLSSSPLLHASKWVLLAGDGDC